MPLTRTRRSTTRQQGEVRKSPRKAAKTGTDKKMTDTETSYDDDDDGVLDNAGEEEYSTNVFMLDGIQYKTYQDMVDAKRKRNQNILKNLGLGDANNKKPRTNASDIQKKKKTKRKASAAASMVTPTVAARKSSRLSRDGSTKLVALDYFVKDWNRDTTVITVENGTEGGDVDGTKEQDDGENTKKDKPTYYKGRLNDGSDMSFKEAMEFNETNAAKWIPEENDENGTLDSFSKLQQSICHLAEETTTEMSSVKGQRTDMNSLQTKIDQLSIDNEAWVAKVTPERIYSVVTHPSTSKLIVCAGDKVGHVGIWDVNATTVSATGSSDGNELLGNELQNGIQHLVRPHHRPICCLEWTTPTCLLSASYDSTVRTWNVETGQFHQIFGTYDDSDSYYAEDLGFGLDEGYPYWIQHVSVDHRFSTTTNDQNPCLFLSTSIGTALHVDLRCPEKERITFNEKLSEKKLNTLRYLSV